VVVTGEWARLYTGLLDQGFDTHPFGHGCERVGTTVDRGEQARGGQAPRLAGHHAAPAEELPQLADGDGSPSGEETRDADLGLDDDRQAVSPGKRERARSPSTLE